MLEYLISITECYKLNNESTITFLTRLAHKIDELSNNEWEKLSPNIKNEANKITLSILKK